MSLQPYVDRHTGATALLFGKGPSLDVFLAGLGEIRTPLRREGVVVAFLNDTIRHSAAIFREIYARLDRAAETSGDFTDTPAFLGIPLSAYIFANDSVESYRADVVSPWTIFQPERTAGHEPAMRRRVIFSDSGGDIHRLGLPRAALADRPLVAGHGTCDSAAQILHIMGCSALVAIGCDGAGGRASLPWATPMRPDHAADYRSIRRDFEALLRHLPLSVEFFPGTCVATAGALQPTQSVA